MKKVSIVGFGRFGKVLYDLIKDDFYITLYDKQRINSLKITKNTSIAKSIAQVYESEVIFFAVPISDFEKVISTHKEFFKKEHVLIDVLSVKIYPAKIFKKYLKVGTQAILSHPMFGPDSAGNSFAGLPIVIDKFTSHEKTFKFWKEYFKSKKLNVIEMSAKEHDQMAANSQGLTHFIGRLLDAYHLEKTSIDSLGVKKLLEIKEQTCNDSWQLFKDLEQYNSYTKQMRFRLDWAYDKLSNKLLPKRVNRKFITYGIQGGKGSFNEEVLEQSNKKAGIKKYRVKYLYTSENVLAALHKGDIDIGQFAIHTSTGGIVEESMNAMAKYKFKIIQQYSMKISHALMIRKDISISNIDTVMTHPQTLAQCKQTLSKKYPRLKQISGEKNLIDPSMVGKYLSLGKLPKNIAAMGSKIIAKIYNLQIIEDNLQDAKENYTSFLAVTRI